MLCPFYIEYALYVAEYPAGCLAGYLAIYLIRYNLNIWHAISGWDYHGNITTIKTINTDISVTTIKTTNIIISVADTESQLSTIDPSKNEHPDLAYQMYVCM